MTRRPCLPVLFGLLLIAGCSGGGSNPVEPAGPDSGSQEIFTQNSGAEQSHRLLLGYWDVLVGADHESFEIIPLRTAAGHYNIVTPVETTWNKSYLTLEEVQLVSEDTLRVSLKLRHPYPENLNYSAFDVRGIFISQADYTFPVTGAEVALGDDVPRMLTYDGYTRIFNPVDYPSSSPLPDLLKYTRGQLAMGWHLTSTVNPYIAFRKDVTRRIFRPSDYEYTSIYIHVPTGAFYFGYALDGSWAQVIEPITNPIKQFPPEANSPEPYEIEISTGRELTPDVGSTTLIGVMAYDREGLDTIESVAIEAPELFSGVRELSFEETVGDDAYLFIGTLTNELGAGYGEYNLVVRVTDTRLDPHLGVVEAWALDTIRIKQGWARTFPFRLSGYCDYAHANGVAVDSSGNILLTGEFKGTGDFDPGPHTDWHETSAWDDHNAFLVRYSPLGEYQRGFTWGGEGTDRGYGVDLDDLGNIYVMGFFTGTTDFDPGPGVAEETSDIATFVSKFAEDGTFLWVRTWGPCYGYGLDVDNSGNAFVTGCFSTEPVDFNPDPDEENWLYSGGETNAYVLCMDTDGNYLWAGNWGEAYGQDIAVDGSGFLYVTGRFEETVDFDPGDGAEEHTSNGDYDIFLSKLDTSGNFQWVRTWGSSNESRHDVGEGVAVDDLGYVYVTGQFWESADFDPGPGEEILTADSLDFNVFVSKLDSSGEFIWARNWGGLPSGGWTTTTGRDVAVDADGNVLISGDVHGTCDFDPGPGVDEHECQWNRMIFLSKFTSSGDYLWARSWEQGYMFGVTPDAEGSIYLCGNVFGQYLSDPCDMDPGESEDIWPGGAFILRMPPDGSY